MCCIIIYASFVEFRYYILKRKLLPPPKCDLISTNWRGKNEYQSLGVVYFNKNVYIFCKIRKRINYEIFKFNIENIALL